MGSFEDKKMKFETVHDHRKLSVGEKVIVLCGVYNPPSHYEATVVDASDNGYKVELNNHQVINVQPGRRIPDWRGFCYSLEEYRDVLQSLK
jgi:sRNA-binding protein